MTTLPVGVVLYGPPASGKSTITAAMHQRDPRFRLLPKLKVGTGRVDGVHVAVPVGLQQQPAFAAQLVEPLGGDELVAVDRRHVEDMNAAGQVPIAHMGNIADLRRLVGRTPDAWLRVLLWVPREVTEQRSKGRGDADTGQRLQAWDETLADLTANTDDGFFHLRIDTGHLDVATAAGEITRAFLALAKAADPMSHQPENTGVHREG